MRAGCGHARSAGGTSCGGRWSACLTGTTALVACAGATAVTHMTVSRWVKSDARLGWAGCGSADVCRRVTLHPVLASPQLVSTLTLHRGRGLGHQCCTVHTCSLCGCMWAAASWRPACRWQVRGCAETQSGRQWLQTAPMEQLLTLHALRSMQSAEFSVVSRRTLQHCHKPSCCCTDVTTFTGYWSD